MKPFIILSLLLSLSVGQEYALEFDGDAYIHIDHIDAYAGINSFTWSSWFRVEERDNWGDSNMFLWNKDHYPSIDQSSIQAYLDFSNSDNKHYINADIDGSGSYEGSAEYYGGYTL